MASTAPIVAMVLMLLCGTPIAVALGVSGMLGIYLVTGDVSRVINILSLVPYSTVADYALTTIPMFILMAYFSASSGLARDLYSAAAAWLSGMVSWMLAGLMRRRQQARAIRQLR